jgi:hypothetical protein
LTFYEGAPLDIELPMTVDLKSLPKWLYAATLQRVLPRKLPPKLAYGASSHFVEVAIKSGQYHRRKLRYLPERSGSVPMRTPAGKE